MKKTSLVLACVLAGIISFAQNATPISIIPEPVILTRTTGSFVLPKTVTVESPDLPAMQQVNTLLKQRLSAATGFTVNISSAASNAVIRLSINKTAAAEIGNEGYQLRIQPSAITITANAPAGLYYGVQSLIQLFPAAIESDSLMTAAWEVPCVDITDYPRFGWRGLMFDVSRHFFTKQEVKDFIDHMAKYKYNLFHWHLTDDEGWRIEIKSLPKLTTKGVMRADKTGYFNTFSAPLPDEPLTYGGFYTQEDIREVIQYAKDRFINVLPEVDVPGHSLAAIVAYPELASAAKEAENYRVRSGEKIMDWHGDGTFTAIVDNSLNPASEKVYSFLDKVFTEVAALFPFDYIHVGGDECAKNFWEKNPEVQALMKKEGLKNLHEVQGYFEKRVGKIITAKGKKLIGWDEILEGGVAQNAAVMSWRGEKGGIEAAKMKHEVVMSPTTFVYLDYMQSDAIMEPRVYATLRLNKTYQFEPVPPGVDPKYIKGGQGNIWTEQIPNVRHLEYMLWPRSFAIAESVWSPKEKKNWDSFVSKVEAHFERFDIMQVKYAPSMYDPIFTAKNNGGKLQIEMATEISGLDIYYSFDNSFPDNYYPKYTGAITPPKDAVMMKVITYRGKKPVGRMIAMPLDEMNKRAGIKK